uniref:Ubiquitin-like domain-containing protein n=1 Tax=Ciona savignyi TaxID=51511 RepID=H2YRA2_CIOSA
MSGSTITISIRAANQHNKDHAIVCEKQWQVKKLKELIAETYAGNPAPNDQRLIYGGKYLLDNEVLSSVLQASNIPNIVPSCSTIWTATVLCANSILFKTIFNLHGQNIMYNKLNKIQLD